MTLSCFHKPPSSQHSHSTPILLLPYTSHPYRISIHLPILTLQYTSHPENNPIASHHHASINLHPHNTPIQLPSSCFHTPPSSQHSHSTPILLLPYTSHPLSQLLRNHSQQYLPVYLLAAGCQDVRCNWRLAAGSRFWITCGLRAPWGWGSAASWRLSWHCRGSRVQTQRSPSKKASLLTPRVQMTHN